MKGIEAGRAPLDLLEMWAGRALTAIAVPKASAALQVCVFVCACFVCGLARVRVLCMVIAIWDLVILVKCIRRW